jgi:uncharacterized protein
MRPFSQSQALIAESVLLDSRLALFHKQEKWLAIADLHFGFELSQRAAGRLVPLWGMESIETRLSQLLYDYRPATLVLLGDLVHDKNGAREFFSLVTRLRNQCDVVLLAGNHDTQIQRLKADLRDSFTTDRFEFHHGDCERAKWAHPDHRAFSSGGDFARWRGVAFKISRAGAGIGLLDFAGVFAVGARNRVDRA